MRLATCIVLLVCVAVVNGCASGEKAPAIMDSASDAAPDSAEQPVAAAEGELGEILKVESLIVAEDKLRLDHRVTNVCPHDLWVCTSIAYAYDLDDPQWSVETEIIDDAFWIRRRGHLEDDYNIHITGSGRYAVYHRLPIRQSRCDTVLLPLPVLSRPFFKQRTTGVWPVVLTQVVLELGYFKDDLSALLEQGEGAGRMIHSQRDRASSEEPDVALIKYFPRRDRWEGLNLEESAKIVIPNVEVPGKWDRPPAENEEQPD